MICCNAEGELHQHNPMVNFADHAVSCAVARAEKWQRCR